MATSFYLMSIFALCSLILIAKVNSNQVKSYDGYTVFRVTPTTNDQLEYLQQLSLIETTENEIDFWSYPTKLNEPVDIMFPPELKTDFDQVFSKKSFTKSILIPNVGELIRMQETQPIIKQKTGFTKEVIPGFWDNYQTLDTINQFIDLIAAQNPSITEIETIGRSYENREIRVIKIGAGHNRHHKPIYFLDSNIHAREWITSATTTYFIQYLIDQYNSNNQTIVDLLNFYDFYIIPVLNPDGFVYTRTERLWRKTRYPNPGSTCIGTDPNRNFNHQWRVAGTSTDPCSQTYGGAAPNDQPEVKALQDYLLVTRPFVYYAVHSYSQVLLYSWGNGTNLPPDNADLLRRGQAATAVLTSYYNTQYRTGTITNLLYAASGNAVDYAYEFCGSKYSYTIELRDTGTYGFQLPPAQIIPSGIETTAFWIKMAQDVREELQ